MNVIKLYLFT